MSENKDRVSISIGTDLLHIVDVNTYNTVISFYKSDDEGYCDEEWLKVYKEDIEYSARHATVEFFTDYKPLEQYGICCDNFKFQSPKEYNFGGDWCQFEMTFNKSLLDKMLETANTDESFANYCKENYSSYDGFISFYPTEMNEFKIGLEPDNHESDLTLCVAMYLNYVIDNDETLATLAYDKNGFVNQYTFEDEMFSSDSYYDSDDYREECGEEESEGLEQLEANKDKVAEQPVTGKDKREEVL